MEKEKGERYRKASDVKRETEGEIRFACGMFWMFAVTEERRNRKKEERDNKKRELRMVQAYKDFLLQRQTGYIRYRAS